MLGVLLNVFYLMPLSVSLVLTFKTYVTYQLQITRPWVLYRSSFCPFYPTYSNFQIRFLFSAYFTQISLSETTTLKVTFILQWAFQQRSWTSFDSLILLDIIVLLLMFLFGACPISYSYITTSSTISHVCGLIILGTLNPHTLVCFDITFESISSCKPFSKLCC